MNKTLSMDKIITFLKVHKLREIREKTGVSVTTMRRLILNPNANFEKETQKKLSDYIRDLFKNVCR